MIYNTIKIEVDNEDTRHNVEHSIEALINNDLRYIDDGIYNLLTIIYFDKLINCVYECNLFYIRKIDNNTYLIYADLSHTNKKEYVYMRSNPICLSKDELLFILLKKYKNQIEEYNKIDLEEYYNSLKLMNLRDLIKNSFETFLYSATIQINDSYIIKSNYENYSYCTDIKDVESFKSIDKDSLSEFIDNLTRL